MGLKETGVKLVAEGASTFLGNMGSATNAVTTFGKQGSFASRGVAALGGGLFTVGKIMTGAFAAGVGVAVAGVGLATKEAISLESAFAGVIKTTDGLTDSSGNLTDIGKEMKQEFRDLAKTVPTSVEELMAIGELGGQLGIARDDLIDFTETIAAVGEATNLTTDEAATGFAQMTNIMGTPTSEIQNMASALVALGNNMATTERDIFDFSTNIAGAGQIAGLTEAQVLGIGAAFSSVGIEASAGGTATQKVLLGINESVLASDENMKVFAETAGISAEDFGKAWETDAGAVFSQFVMGLGTAGDDAVGILQSLGLEDQRLIKAFLSLAGAGDLITESMDISTQAFEENTALMTEAEARYATTESQLAIFKNTLRDMGFTIGEAVLPFLNDMLEQFKPIIAQVGAQLPGLINDFLIPALTKMGQWIGEFLPVAMEILSTFFAEKWPLIQEAIGNAWAIIQPVLISIGQWLSEDGPGFLTTLQTAFQDVWGVIQDLISQFSEFWDENGEQIIAIAQSIGNFFTNNFLPALKIVWNTIKTLISTVVGAMLAIINAALAALRGDWSEAWGYIQEYVSGVWDTIKELVTGALEAIATLFGSSLEEISTMWSDNWENFKEILSLAWEAIHEFFVEQIAAIKEKLIAFGTNLYTLGSDLMQGLLDGIMSKVADIIAAVVGAVQDAIAAAKAALNIKSPSKRASDELGEPISEGVAVGIAKGADQIKGSLSSAITGAIDGAFDPGMRFPISFDKPTLPEGFIPQSPEELAVNREIKSAFWERRRALAASEVIPPTLSGEYGGNRTVDNSRSVTIYFEGNYASQPAITDQADLSLLLGISGVLA